MTAAIDTEGLLELVWAAPLAAIAVALAYSVFIYGAARASEHRREGNAMAATAFGVVSALAGIVFAGIVVAGVAVIVSK